MIAISNQLRTDKNLRMPAVALVYDQQASGGSSSFDEEEFLYSSRIMPLGEFPPEIFRFLGGRPKKDAVSKREISLKERKTGNRLELYKPLPSPMSSKPPLAVPVVGRYGKPLMPCHPARARELVNKGKAIDRYTHGIYYIRLLQRKTGTIQRVFCGIDPGSEEESFTVRSEKRTFMNIQADAITYVRKVHKNKNGIIKIIGSVKDRVTMRRQRRRRKTPYRANRTNHIKCKFTKRANWLPPSTKARWAWKLRIINVLVSIFPITQFVIEDVKARTFKTMKKNRSKWNLLFSPVQHGKNWFYTELAKMGNILLVPGYITAKLRESLGLIKDKKRGKKGQNFYRHCVDSWVLAWLMSGGNKKIDETRAYYIAPVQLHRRELHDMCPSKNAIRNRYGGTRDLGFKRGSLVKHKTKGALIVRGHNNRQLRGVPMQRNAKNKDPRICVNITDCTFLAYNTWYLEFK